MGWRPTISFLREFRCRKIIISNDLDNSSIDSLHRPPVTVDSEVYTKGSQSCRMESKIITANVNSIVKIIISNDVDTSSYMFDLLHISTWQKFLSGKVLSLYVAKHHGSSLSYAHRVMNLWAAILIGFILSFLFKAIFSTNNTAIRNILQK